MWWQEDDDESIELAVLERRYIELTEDKPWSVGFEARFTLWRDGIGKLCDDALRAS